jgi:hypothetical protein
LRKTSRAYKSSKRNRELKRLKKQEEKRLRRLGKAKAPEPSDAESTPGE